MRGANIRRWRALAAFGLILAAGPVRSETLEDVVAQTLATSPDVQIDAARRQAADETVNQAVGSFLPRVDISEGRGHQYVENTSVLQTYGKPTGQLRYDRSLTLSQMLFDGGAAASEVGRNRARVASAAHRVASTSEQVALRAVEAYLEVLRNQELMTLTQDNLTVHQRTYDQIRLRAASGVGRKADQDQIEARLALAKSNLTAAEANLKVAEINYRLVVGARPSALAAPKAPDAKLIPETPEAAVPIGIENNPLLKSAKADIAAAIAQNSAARAPMFPRVDLELSGSRNTLQAPTDLGPQPDFNRSAMVRMRYNLFRGGADMARIAETRFQINEAEEIARRTERQIEQSMRLSWNAYTSAAARMPFLNKHAEASQATREAYNKQFALGQRTLLDLLDAENEAFTAASNLLNGRFVELFSRYRVLADMGMLLSVLGVAPRDEAVLGR